MEIRRCTPEATGIPIQRTPLPAAQFAPYRIPAAPAARPPVDVNHANGQVDLSTLAGRQVSRNLHIRHSHPSFFLTHFFLVPPSATFPARRWQARVANRREDRHPAGSGPHPHSQVSLTGRERGCPDLRHGTEHSTWRFRGRPRPTAGSTVRPHTSQVTIPHPLSPAFARLGVYTCMPIWAFSSHVVKLHEFSSSRLPWIVTFFAVSCIVFSQILDTTARICDNSLVGRRRRAARKGGNGLTQEEAAADGRRADPAQHSPRQPNTDQQAGRPTDRGEHLAR